MGAKKRWSWDERGDTITSRCKEMSKECVWGQISPGSFPEYKVLGNKAKISSLLVCATDTVAYFRCKIILPIAHTASDDSCGGGLETRLHSSPLKPHTAHPSHFPVSTSCLSCLLVYLTSLLSPVSLRWYALMRSPRSTGGMGAKYPSHLSGNR